jgi:hypothetical protein
MDYKELLEKYQALLVENNHLKAEIKRLKSQQGIPEQQGIPFDFFEQNSTFEILGQNSMRPAIAASINNFSDPMEKIQLFMSLFKGRDDVYAKRWENQKKGIFGYSPVCLNEWQPGLCARPKGKCADCVHKSYKQCGCQSKKYLG